MLCVQSLGSRLYFIKEVFVQGRMFSAPAELVQRARDGVFDYSVRPHVLEALFAVTVVEPVLAVMTEQQVTSSVFSLSRILGRSCEQSCSCNTSRTPAA